MIIRKLIINIQIIASLILLYSCTVGPDYEKPKVEVKDQWATKSKNFSDELAINWWKIFNDKLLEKYINEAVENNNEIKIAYNNLLSSNSFVDERRAAFIPGFGFQQDSTRRRTSGSSEAANAQGVTFNVFNMGLGASWQIDIFGGNRRALESARFLEKASAANYNDVILTVISSVATRYFQIRQAQKQIEITKQNAQLFKKTMEIVDARVKVGEADDFDLVRTKGEYERIIANVPNLEANMYQAIYSLSILLDKPPEYLLKEVEVFKSFPVPPENISIGTRLEMLSRRPDIREAESLYGSSVADIGVEVSNLYPKFNLLGRIGSNALTFKDMTSVGSSKLWFLTNVIDWQIFEGGAIRARVANRNFISKAQYFGFKQTVLNAMANSDIALVRYKKELETYSRLKGVVATRTRAMEIAKKLFDSGETNYLDVLDVERELTTSKENLVLSKTQAVLNLVTLYTELGGGWESFGAPYANNG